jgi:hypothetical protein
MFSREEAKQLMEEIKENHRKLAACEGPHDFRPSPSQNYPAVMRDKGMSDRWTCMRCHGWVYHEAHLWYERGRAHGQKEKPS